MTVQKHYLYVFEMLGYGKQGNPKIGITKNIKNRERQLWHSYGGRIPKLVALFEFDDITAARIAELRIIQKFTPYLPPAREIFRESCSTVVSFIESCEFPCVRISLS